MALIALVGSLASTAARADDDDDVATTHEGSPERDAYTKHDWPVQPILRPLTLAPAMREVSGDTFLINFSSGSAFEPIALAPDLHVGISRRLTIGVIHDLGICVSSNGCGSTYNDLGLEATYSVLDASSIQAAVRLGLQAPRFSRFFLGARGGMTVRLRLWPVALVLSPTVYVGMVNRDDLPAPDVGEPEPDPVDAVGRADILDMPVQAQLQIGSQFLVTLSSGVRGPLSGFADAYAVPFGFGGTFAINHKVDLGLAWRFDNLLGKAGSADGRALLIRAALRF